jgi:hypothetical protein
MFYIFSVFVSLYIMLIISYVSLVYQIYGKVTFLGIFTMDQRSLKFKDVS